MERICLYPFLSTAHGQLRSAVGGPLSATLRMASANLRPQLIGAAASGLTFSTFGDHFVTNIDVFVCILSVEMATFPDYLR